MLLWYMRSLCVNALGILFVCWVSMIVMARVYDFHTAYIHFVQQIESERWLHTQCADAAFFQNMQYHTDVCEQVMQNRETSPVIYALNASLQQMKLCGLTDCTTLAGTVYAGGTPLLASVLCVYIFTPSFLLPLAQGWYERHQQRSLLRRCTPTYAHLQTSDQRIKYV